MIGGLCRILAAVYQLPDGLYGVSSGVLRGLGMQPRLLWVNLGGFWGVGILLGILLTFKAHVGVIGLWWGLLSGIVSTGDACYPTLTCIPPAPRTGSHMHLNVVVLHIKSASRGKSSPQECPTQQLPSLY